MLICLALVVVLSVSLTLFVSPIPQLCFAFLASAASTAWSVCGAPAVAQLTTEQNRPFAFSVTGSTGIGLGVVASLPEPSSVAMLGIPSSTRTVHNICECQSDR